MREDFKKIYEFTNEKIEDERKQLKEYKMDIRQSEGLIIGIIIICIIVAIIAPTATAKYIFVTVAVMMFLFCTFYTFKGERRIIEKQNKFSEIALSELAVHIKDGFTYEKDEELSGSYYRKSGFNRIYKELESQGVISGTRNGHKIALSNIIVNSESKELFRGIFACGTIKKEIDEIDVMRVNSKNNKKEKYAIPGQDLYMYSERISKARQVLTDEKLEFIKQFKEETKYKLEMMINKNMVFFRFFDNDILTKPITNNKETEEYMYKYYRIIAFMSEFIEMIDN